MNQINYQVEVLKAQLKKLRNEMYMGMKSEQIWAKLEAKELKLMMKITGLEKKEPKMKMKYEQIAEDFNEILDEGCAEIEVGAYSFSPSEVLKKMDPVAYHQEILDFAGAHDIEIE